ncbi:MAG: hypothetical protein IJ047_01560 [Paludibacteraceae bacterium]|nr:hypothetical protein [Paludibacteraceae bacterium]
MIFGYLSAKGSTDSHLRMLSVIGGDTSGANESYGVCEYAYIPNIKMSIIPILFIVEN